MLKRTTRDPRNPVPGTEMPSLVIGRYMRQERRAMEYKVRAAERPASHVPLPASRFPLPTSHFTLPTSHFPLGQELDSQTKGVNAFLADGYS